MYRFQNSRASDVHRRIWVRRPYWPHSHGRATNFTWRAVKASTRRGRFARRMVKCWILFSNLNSWTVYFWFLVVSQKYPFSNVFFLLHHPHDHHDRLFNISLSLIFCLLCFDRLSQVVIYCMDSAAQRKTTFWPSSIDESRTWRRNWCGLAPKRSLDSPHERGNGLMVIKERNFIAFSFVHFAPHESHLIASRLLIRESKFDLIYIWSKVRREYFFCLKIIASQ